MDAKQALFFIIDQLNKIYDKDSSNSIAWHILETATNLSRTEILALKEYIISDEQLEFIKNILVKHVQDHEPLQYLLGSVQFLNLCLAIKAPVLIPRPETEEWCEKLINELKKLKSDDRKNLKVLDLCSGSGAIGLALAYEFSEIKVIGVDIEQYAIDLANKNSEINNIKNIKFSQGNLFENLTDKYDLIVTNPPYISLDEWKTLDDRVKKWEASRALLAEADGLAIIEKIIKQAKYFLNEKSILKKYNLAQLWIEIGYNQGNQVEKLLVENNFRGFILKDSAGKNRVAQGYLL